MITHYIIMSSSYTKGKRIALHYLVEKNEYSSLKAIMSKIVNECGKDVSVSTHFIQTDSKSWNSVIEKDHFFKDVELVSNFDKFTRLIKEDRILKGIDVANYILTKVKCTHLKLEKLVYYCYAEYLCKFNNELFNDKIYAYKYGPIVKSVYNKYKKYGYKEIEEENIVVKNIFEMPSKSRILFAKDGINKIKSIDETIERYGNFSASDLVELTHKNLTPWSVSGSGQKINGIIKDNIIKEYHHYETI